MKTDIYLIPAPDSPLWAYLVKNITKYQFKTLPTQIVMMQVYLLAKEGTETRINQAIHIMYTFFQKNKFLVQEDIQIINSLYQRKFQKYSCIESTI